MTIVKKMFMYLILIVLLVTTLIVLVVASEYATRYILRDITTTGDNGSYFAKQWRFQQFGRGNTKYNSWRRRECEFDRVAPENTYRIVVIGDSITYGQGIPEEERFTNRLAYEMVGSKTQFRGDLISRYFSSAEHAERKIEWRSDKICNRDEKISGFKGGNHTRKKQELPIKKQLSAALDFQENYLRVIERQLVSYSIWMTLRMDLGMKGG